MGHAAIRERPASACGPYPAPPTTKQPKKAEEMSATAQPSDVEERRYFGTSKYGWRVVLFSGAGWFFDGYVINVWPLAIPFVMTDLHLTVTDIGTITTLYVTAYMLGTLLGGTFADYLGRRSVLSFS